MRKWFIIETDYALDREYKGEKIMAKMPMEYDGGGIILGTFQNASVPATTAGSIKDIDVVPTAISGYTAIGVMNWQIEHPTLHEIRSIYITTNSPRTFRIRVGSNAGSSSADTLSMQFLYVSNNLFG